MRGVRIVRLNGVTAGGRVRRIAVGIAAGLLGATLVTLAVGAFADGTSVCGQACHAMRPYASAAADGAHRGVTCAECHGGSGVLGSLADGWALERRGVSTLLGRSPVASSASDAACRSCHPAVGESTFVSRGIAVRHKDFIDEPCGACHGGTGHALARRVYEVPQMDDCMNCHSSSSREVEGCELCHVPDADRDRLKRTSTWQITHGKEWRTTHGMGDLGTCVSCHVPTYCARCHEVTLPHPRVWPKIHGEGARVEGIAACHACHEKEWCEECHGVAMPHPKGFLPDHGPIAEDIGQDRCLRCHPQAGCDDCHLKSSHPDIPGVEGMHTATTGGAP